MAAGGAADRRRTITTTTTIRTTVTAEVAVGNRDRGRAFLLLLQPDHRVAGRVVEESVLAMAGCVLAFRPSRADVAVVCVRACLGVSGGPADSAVADSVVVDSAVGSRGRRDRPVGLAVVAVVAVVAA